MNVMLVVTIVGAVILLLSLLLGDVLEGLDIGVSATAVGAALALFGAVGLVAGTAPVVLLVAAVVAILAGVGVQWIIAHAIRTESSANDYEVVGLEGVATALTGPGSGQVRLDHPLETGRRVAWSRDYIEVGSRVRVVAVDGVRVQVEPIPR